MAKNSARRAEPAETEGKYERAMRKVKATAPRDPLFPEPGPYDCTFLGLDIPEVDPGQLEWARVSFEHEGNNYTQLHLLSGKIQAKSLGLLKALGMSIMGTANEEEYDGWDPKGKFVSALQGIDNAFSETAAEAKGAARVRVNIARGNDTPDGKDWYRDATYGVCPDAAGDDEDEPESEPAPKAKKGKRA